MTKEPKITKDKLKQELENGKPVKEIAYEYGYGYPSRALSDKIRDLGYVQNQKLSIDQYGGTQFYASSDVVSESLEKRDLENINRKFFKTNVKKNGVIEIIPTKNKWRKED